MNDEEKAIFKSMLDELNEGDIKERTCPYCQTELLLPIYMYKDFHCPYCGKDIANMRGEKK